jgi:hydrogenase/urease accessory protein HupE
MSGSGPSDRQRAYGLSMLAGASWTIAVLAVGASSTFAHVGGSTGYASIAISGNTVRYSLTLSPSAAPPAIAETLVLARAGDLASRERILGAIRQRISFIEPGNRCEPAREFVEAARPGVEGVTMVVDFACAARVRNVVIRDDLFDVLGTDHHTLARIEAAGITREFAFATESRETRVVLEESGGPSGPGGFFLLGVHHILTGYDHLLFLLALLLRGGTLLSLIKIVTAFTVAHSITLALAVLGVVTLPDRLVESVIAASIVWVAVENVIVTRPPRRRWLVGFVFGLVHGFGFSSALGPLALPTGRLAWALFTFNLGVEAGQTLVIVALLPALVWLERRQWPSRVVQAASLAVAAAGLVWLIERVFLA